MTQPRGKGQPMGSHVGFRPIADIQFAMHPRQMLKVILILSAWTASEWTVAQQSMGAVPPPAAAPLEADALRTLLDDAYVSLYRGGYDGPGEFFRTNGSYQREGGHGAIVFEGRFEVRGGAVCVLGDGSVPICRRVVANSDGTYTFTNASDGTSAVMNVTQSR